MSVDDGVQKRSKYASTTFSREWADDDSEGDAPRWGDVRSAWEGHREGAEGGGGGGRGGGGATHDDEGVHPIGMVVVVVVVGGK